MLHAKSAVEGSRRAHKRCLDHCRAQWCHIGGMPLRQLHAVAQAVMRVDVGRAPTRKSCLLLYLSCSSILSDRDRSWTERSASATPSVLSIASDRRTDGRAVIGTEPRAWEESLDFPSSQPPTRGPPASRTARPCSQFRFILSALRESGTDFADLITYTLPP